MSYFLLKAALSGFIIATVSEVARRAPGLGALIASLPLISVLGMIWLWRAKPDAANMAAHATATFWYVLPSLPMFLLIPMLLKRGVGFWPALAAGCALTVALYGLVTLAAPRFGLRLWPVLPFPGCIYSMCRNDASAGSRALGLSSQQVRKSVCSRSLIHRSGARLYCIERGGYLKCPPWRQAWQGLRQADQSCSARNGDEQ